MQRTVEAREQPAVAMASGTKKQNKCRSFHFRYLELCRSKNINPLAEIRSKNNATSMLEMYCDKVTVTEWLLIIEALHYDQVLQTISLRMRKNHGCVIEQLDTEKKAKLFKQKPSIYTKFIFSGLIEAVANCIEFNKSLKVLKLEGLPLSAKYIECIAKSLASNDSIKELSLHRSRISDDGCEAICNTVKYLNFIEKIDLSDCELTEKGAEHVADMIKMQKISRFTEGWEKSLRYRDVDVNSISGLRSISIARNPEIGDEGVKVIAEVLKEDAWVKVIDMENCGLTDRGANTILDCLDYNSSLTDFGIRNNDKISKYLQRNIRDHLGKGEDERDEGMLDGAICGMKPMGKNKKYSQAQLIEQIHCLQEQLAFERTLRKKAEQLNEKLNTQIMSYESQAETHAKNASIPEGYVVVRNDSLQSIIEERNNFHKLVNSVCTSPNLSPRSEIITIRHKQADTVEKPPAGNPIVNALDMEPRKVTKVRKVKSEMKYVEPPTKNAGKKNESKSDHEFANEAEITQKVVVEVDTNIGDTAAVKKHINIGHKAPNKINNRYSNNMMHLNEEHTQMAYVKSMSNNMNGNYVNNKRIDIDQLSISSTRESDWSSDSDTLRNSNSEVNLKPHYMRHGPMEIGQGEGCINKKTMSLQHMFMGRSD